MKKLLVTSITISLLCSLAFAGDKKWDLFARNIKYAVSNDNPGVKLSALKMVIRFYDKLKDSEHFDGISIVFKNSKEPGIRKMALLVLYKLDSSKAIEFYKSHLNLEEDKTIHDKLETIVNAYNKDIELANAQVDSCYEICKCCNFVSLKY